MIVRVCEIAADSVIVDGVIGWFDLWVVVLQGCVIGVGFLGYFFLWCGVVRVGWCYVAGLLRCWFGWRFC